MASPIALLISAALVLNVAATAEESVYQTARATSRFMAISRVCPPLIPTDAAGAQKFVDVYSEAGRKFAGDEWDDLIGQEVERRQAEIETAGEQLWCEDQRRYLLGLGVRGIFPQSR